MSDPRGSMKDGTITWHSERFSAARTDVTVYRKGRIIGWLAVKGGLKQVRAAVEAFAKERAIR
jgi:hypothetical protein